MPSYGVETYTVENPRSMLKISSAGCLGSYPVFSVQLTLEMKYLSPKRRCLWPSDDLMGVVCVWSSVSSADVTVTSCVISTTCVTSTLSVDTSLSHLPTVSVAAAVSSGDSSYVSSSHDAVVEQARQVRKTYV